MIKASLFIIFSIITVRPFTSTGNIMAGSGATTDRSTGTAWTSPGNVTADDAADATCNAASLADYLHAYNFGFTLPAGSTINGVLVRLEASEHSGGTEALLARLVSSAGTDPPTLLGTAKSTSNEGAISGTVKAIYTYGSTSDLWGATLTESDVESSTFGVVVYFSTGHDVRIDFITMAIEYTVPASHRIFIITKSAKSITNNEKVKI